jgi:hypothetical protein
MKHALTLLLLCACAANKDTPADDSDTPDDATCPALEAGTWSGNGSCFGMSMSATLSADGCGFTFSDWNMAMDVPEGGELDGETFTLTGDGWTDCTGTATATSMEGACDDGCVFEMTRE